MPALAQGWRYVAALLLLVTFTAILAANYQETAHPPALGLRFATNAANGTIVVSSVSLTSDDTIRVERGDVVIEIDGIALAPGAAVDLQSIERASRVVVQRPGTGEQIAVGVPRYVAGVRGFLPFLLIGAIFFAVGIIALVLGHGAAPRALALLCCTGAFEALCLPHGIRNVPWALVMNGLGVPLFMGGFAYLFLVFPTRRHLPFGKRRLRAEWVLLPTLPLSAAYITLVFAPSAGLLIFTRLVGFPYFLACLLGGTGALIVNWRRAATLRERAQLRIIGAGTILAVVPFLSLELLPMIATGQPAVPLHLSVLSLGLIPLAFGYAILRYQVMNMHLFVRRGVVYSIVGAIITGVYALTLALATIVVQDRAAELGAFLVPAMVAIVVLLGDRLRAAVQRWVDRLFDREGYDYRARLIEFSQRMNSILDPDELAQSSVDLIGQTMGARHVRLYLHNPAEGTFLRWVHAGAPVPPDEETLGPHHPTVAEVRAAGWEIVQHFEIPSAADSLLVPLIHKGQPVALLTLGLKRADLPYSSEDLALLRTVASQLAIATENAQLYGRMRELYLSGIRTLAATVDAKDAYTHGHSERVAKYARAIATALGLPQLEIETIELAGLLHDIGKIGVPDAILQKPGRLDPDERVLIEGHADLGARILADNPALMPLVPYVRHHHERWDGRGYPSGLGGEEIPLGAAIICVADTYDTMTTDRPYRRAPGLEEARAEIVRCGGAQFSPRVVEAFLRASATEGWLAAPQQRPGEGPAERGVAGQATDVNTRAMRVVYQIAQFVGGATDLPAYLGRVVELLRRELGTRAVDVFTVDATTGSLRNEVAIMEGRDEPIVPAGCGLVGWVAEQQTAARVDDTREDPRAICLDGWEGRSELAVPLISEGRTVAVLNVESARVGAFTEDDATLLTIIAGQLAQVIAVARLHDEVRRAARLDGLTGIANHRHFYDRLEVEIERAQRAGAALSLAVLDVDGLKALNDTHGHLTGDAALRALARLLTDHSGPGELVARYGGDEFAILFPGLGEPAARERVGDLLGAVRAAGRFEAAHGTLPLPAVSAGIASLGPDADRAISLVALADARMYRQKVARRAARGRGREAVGAAFGEVSPPCLLSAEGRDDGVASTREVVPVAATGDK